MADPTSDRLQPEVVGPLHPVAIMRIQPDGDRIYIEVIDIPKTLYDALPIEEDAEGDWKTLETPSIRIAFFNPRAA